MNPTLRSFVLFGLVALALVLTGINQSWTLALTILNMSLISAILALGVNIQWGYAGLFNVGVMGFTAIGGLAVVLVSVDPVPEAWRAGGFGALLGLALGAATVSTTTTTGPTRLRRNTFTLGLAVGQAEF